MGHDDTPEGKPPKPEPPANVAELPPDVAEYVKGLGGPDPEAPPPPKSPPGETPTTPQDPSEWTLKLRPDVRLSDGTTMVPDGAPTGGSGGAGLRKWAAIAAGAIVAIVIAMLLAHGGGGDEQQAGGGDSGPQPGAGGFLAAAGLPTDLAYTATNLATGQSFKSTLRVNSSCTGNTCKYTSAFNPGAGMVRGPIPTVTWSHNGDDWHVVLTAPILSSSTGGADCVYMYTDTWDLTVLGAERGGGLLRAVQLRGTLSRNQRMDPSLSRGVGTTCLSYDNTQTYNVTATPA